MGSDRLEILASKSIPLSQSYILQFLLYYQEMMEIQSKNRFLGTFLGVFSLHPLTPYELRPNFWPKGLIEIHKHGKFHHCGICCCEVIYLQRFSEQQKVGFLAASEWFFKDYSPKWSRICTKSSPVMHCMVTHHIYYGFLKNVKNS